MKFQTTYNTLGMFLIVSTLLMEAECKWVPQGLPSIKAMTYPNGSTVYSTICNGKPGDPCKTFNTAVGTRLCGASHPWAKDIQHACLDDLSCGCSVTSPDKKFMGQIVCKNNEQSGKPVMCTCQISKWEK